MRRRDAFDRRSFGASLGVHVGLLALVFGSSPSARPPVDFVSYHIEIVSPPPLTQAAEDVPAQERLVVERPEPQPVRQEEPRPAPVTETRPRPPEPPAQRSNPLAEPAEENKPAASTAPASPTGTEGGEGINVRLEGVRRDYPEYYNNIIRQIVRCFRWQGQGSWETTVYFQIHRDGKVSDLRVLTRSGNPAFDIEAMGAVECAGQGRLGSLPSDLPWDVLPVQFRFSPQGRIRDHVPDAAPTQETETAKR